MSDSKVIRFPRKGETEAEIAVNGRFIEISFETEEERLTMSFDRGEAAQFVQAFRDAMDEME